MADPAELKSRLQQLSPQQRSALLRQLALRKQQEQLGSGHADAWPLSRAQQRLWYLSQLGEDAAAAYNLGSAFLFDSELDAERLRRAWRQLLQRHEVLRSVFGQHGDVPFQYPRAAHDWDIGLHCWSGTASPEVQLAELAARELARPFDLQQDWLLRVILCRGSDAGATQGQGCGLVVVMHHIVCDGLSITQMIHELQAAYAADDDQIDALPASRGHLQYRDFVAHEALVDTADALQYWKQQFQSLPETPDHLFDLPRPSQRDFRGAVVGIEFPAAQVARFERYCHAHQATLYMGLLALVQLLLARFAGVSDIAIGTPVAGRPDKRFAQVVGPFVNTIALRQTVDVTLGFGDLLAATRSCVLGGFEHQGLPFDTLVSALGLGHDAARSPLYDVMLGLNTEAEQQLRFGSSSGRSVRVPSACSKVDLTFHFERLASGALRLDLEYATALLRESRAQRLYQAAGHLLRELPAAETEPMWRLPLQSEAERRFLLEQVNATTRPYPRESTIIAEFSHWVARTPDAPAVMSGTGQLSYRELEQRADTVAAYLQQQPGYRPGCRIGFMLEKDERALILMLAILKSQAVYVPLAANTPDMRVEYIVQTGELAMLVVESGTLAVLQSLPLAVLDVATVVVADEPSAAKPEYSSTVADPGTPTPAYLMFTSGSTGKPKGTLIGQASVLRLVCNTDYHQVQAGERVLLTGSLAFDAATFEIWGALLNGGTVCIPPGTTLLDVHEFDSLIRRFGVNTAFLTTGLFNQLVDHALPAFAELGTVLTGGEKISVEHVRRLLQACPQLKLLHVYGPTENTTFSTWHRIVPDDLLQPTIPIGKPLANSRVYLLDAHLQPVPVGVPGEICCGGDGVALGYLGAEPAAASSTAFMPDPFVPGARLYRSGDLACWSEAGELVFLGRNDRQVKIRGFRVELGEVEQHLRTLPGVRDAFALVQGTAGAVELCAWLVTDEDTYASVAAVRAALQARVPAYMLPAKVRCIAALPLNASGKVDARALPALQDAEAEAVQDHAEPLQGEVEGVLAGLFAKVLGLRDATAVGRDANFFSLGGDSIRAIQLVALAREAGYRFALKDLFSSNTLAGLAAEVEPVAANEAPAPAARLREGPLSPVQRWWLDQPGMPADHFNLSAIFAVPADIDLDLLRTALEQLLELHPVLRVELDPARGTQRIRDAGRFVLLVAEPGSPRSALWQQLQQSIDLAAGVLLAVGVATDADETRLGIVLHHLAADELSGRLLAENLERLYLRARHQGGTGAAPCAEPLREVLGYVDWSAQLAAAVADGALDEDAAYWCKVQEQGSKALQSQQTLFPSQHTTCTEVERCLSHERTLAVLAAATQWLQMKPQELLLAAFLRAWEQVTAQSSPQTSCLLMLEGHGREALTGAEDCSSTLGWFTSLYPFVAPLQQERQLDLYRQVKDGLRQVPRRGFSYLPLRYLGTPDLQQALQLSPLLSFNYLGETVGEGPGDGTGEQTPGSWLQPRSERVASDHAADLPEPFRLDVLCRQSDGRIELMVRGETPAGVASLSQLLDAWSNELDSLEHCLQQAATDLSRAQPLLSLTESLVPFASLQDMDRALAELAVPPACLEAVLPLTAMQAGMWLHCAGNSGAYQDQVVMQLQDALDPRRFATAVAALVAETPALRSGFGRTRQGELLQVVWRERQDIFRFVDGREWGDAADQKAEALRQPWRSAPCDLLRDPLFALTLVQREQGLFELVIDFHHIAVDGWSSTLLLQRLEDLYFGTAQPGDAAALPGMQGYFAWLAQQPAAAARTYWEQLVGDYAGRSEVPAPLPRVTEGSPVPTSLEQRTGPARYRRLQAWCIAQGLTVNAAIQTLWGILLADRSGSDDVVFGATVSGRDIALADVQRMAGMLINTLPLRIRIDRKAGFAVLVRRTAQQLAASMTHAHLSLAEIQTLSPARSDLVTHALIFENYPGTEPDAARWHWQPVDIYDPMHFEFGLLVAPLRDDLSLRFVADGRVHTAASLQQLGQELCQLLDRLLDDDTALAADTGAASPRGWAIAANFTADPLVPVLRHHEYLSGRSAAVSLLPYDQIMQELLNPDSRLQALQPQYNVVLWRPRPAADGAVAADAALEQLELLGSALAAHARQARNSRYLFVLCPWYACDTGLYRELGAFARGTLAGLPNVQLLLPDTLAEDYALDQYCLPPEQCFGDIPYTDAWFAALGSRLMRLRDLAQRRPVKVYAVDADDTLWGGVVGEDGVEGLQLHEGHLLLQQRLLAAREAGALLCLVTKNNEADVRAVFAARAMPLQWEHFTAVRAAWGPKSDSISELALALSLGLDSFVFLDDSRMEVEQVAAACPQVQCVLLPAEQRERFVRHLWLLDSKAATREDRRRADMYAEELQRHSVRRAAGSFSDFLASLQVQVRVAPALSAELPRLAQLSERTNQFNTTGIRYAETALLDFMQGQGNELRSVHVSDRFGDYGLVGAVYIRRHTERWTITGFMLSCRVLGRGVEHTVLQALAQEAAALAVEQLCVDFVRLPRNTPALQFLEALPGAAGTASDAASWQYQLATAGAADWLPLRESSPATRQDVEAAAPATAELAESAPDSATVARTRFYSVLATRLNSASAILDDILQRGSVHRRAGLAGGAGQRGGQPRTPLEQQIAGYFAELLQLAEPGRDDSFLDFGGHSLSAMQLFSRIAAHCGVVLDYRDLVAAPTVAALATRVEQAMQAQPLQPAMAAIPLVADAEDYPASAGQARLWMLEQLRGDGASPFHMQVTLLIDGPVDRVALDRALQALAARHEVLRTCLVAGADGKPRQQVRPVEACALKVQWQDAVLDDGALDAEVQRWTALPFDLASAPLLRISAVRLVSGRTALMICLHHSIGDGWSMGILARELSLLYQGAAIGTTPALRFRDFAAWQLDWLESEPGLAARAWWRTHFAEPVEPLQLPARGPRPAISSGCGASVALTVDAALWGGFRQRLASAGSSDFSGLLAALQYLLFRMSGQRNFCIGTAVAGRLQPALEPVLGFFANVLPLRSCIDPEASVEAFLTAVTAEVSTALQHQAVPFDCMVSDLALPRDPGRSPLFDVMLVLQNMDDAKLSFDGQVAQVHPVESQTSQHDLVLTAYPDAKGGLHLNAEFDSAIYDHEHMRLLLRCLQVCMQAMAQAADESLQTLSWVDAADLKLVLSFEQRPRMAVAAAQEPGTLPALVRAMTPAAAGRIVHGELSWSYAQLLAHADSIAGLLQQQAAGRHSPESRRQFHAGVIGQRSVQSIAAMLGVMSAGMVYLPLDIVNPLSRLSAIVADGEVDFLLFTDAEGESLAVELQRLNPRLQLLQMPEAQQERTPAVHAPMSEPDPDDIAYMIHTSGSTGRPKGVPITHRAFLGMIREQITAFGVQEQDVCGQFAALTFDASLSEIFLALGTGASLVLAPEQAKENIEVFLHWLQQTGVTILTLPPAFLRAVARRPLASLRVLITAGEAAIAEDMQHYARSLQVFNAYGPTEAAVCASTYAVGTSQEWPFGVPIGAPLPGVTLSVRDASGQRVPISVDGELYIAGPCLTPGYYAAPELNAHKFVDSVEQGLSTRWYRSGDLVRWRRDGQLEFVGRTDTQIKLRGYRIEPAEIEHAARALDDVQDAVALVHPTQGLVLYCVIAASARNVPELPEWAAACRHQLALVLPRHMVPGQVVALDAFPLSSAGKVDRKALLDMAANAGMPYEAPVTPEERLLAAIWQQLLQVPAAGRNDDFFALGGDSIKALEVLAALRRAGYSVALRDFFRSPGLGELALALVAAEPDGDHSAPLAGPLDLLPIQQWFLESRNAAEAAHFNIAVEVLLPEGLAPATIEAALQQLLAAHEALRARFVQEAGGWRQEIVAPSALGTILQLQHGAQSGAGAGADEGAAEDVEECSEAEGPFDLARGPLFRFILRAVRANAAGSSLLVVLHHLIADWVSLRILLADLEALLALQLEPGRREQGWYPPARQLPTLVARRRDELQATADLLLGRNHASDTHDEYLRARAIVSAHGCAWGRHRDLQTSHASIPAEVLQRLLAAAEQAGGGQDIRGYVLAAVLAELGSLFPADEIPLLIEAHGRETTLDLSRQVAWLTRARVICVDRRHFAAGLALQQASTLLQTREPDGLDVFLATVADPEGARQLPAWLGFNYLGDFGAGQNAGKLLQLADSVFKGVVSPDSPIDLPLQLEFYKLNGRLELQMSWAPAMFEAGALQRGWEQVCRRLLDA